MRAGQITQPDPITIVSSMPFLEIQSLFVTAQIGGAPVIDERGDVIGMIDTFDLLRAIDLAFDDDIDPGEARADREGVVRRISGLTAAEVMTPNPVWVEVDTPVVEIARLMRTDGIHRVLVRDAGGRLVGILTTFDLLRALDGVETSEPSEVPEAPEGLSG